MAALAEVLSRLDEPALTRLLERRPHALVGAPPRTIDELAQRLEHPETVLAVLQTVPLPCLQVLEAVQALGAGATKAELTHLLGAGPDDPDVDRVLQELVDLALVWPGDGDRVQAAAGVAAVFPNPLGLASSVRELLPLLNVQDMRKVALKLGVSDPPTRRGELEDILEKWLSDSRKVRALVASAPDEVAAVLVALADPSPTEEVDEYGRRSYDPASAVTRQTAYKWANERGLLLGAAYTYAWSMPAQVALALRGPDYRAPFHPRRPEPILTPIAEPVVRQAASASATDFAQQTAGLLDLLARTPYPLAKAGGLGVRELARIAKATVVEISAARLSLEVAYAAGLLDVRDGQLRTSEEFPAWRAAEPAARYAELLVAWWLLPYPPSDAVDLDGKTLRPLSHVASVRETEVGREGLLSALATLPTDRATDLPGVIATVHWDRPVADMLLPGEASTVAAAWNEGTALGVVAAGTLTDLGRALLKGDLRQLVPLATALLPASSERAVFGSDLTVMVAGSPAAKVSMLLDSVATRESRGAAITWRFSTESVRRALDEGADASALSAEPHRWPAATCRNRCSTSSMTSRVGTANCGCPQRRP